MLVRFSILFSLIIFYTLGYAQTIRDLTSEKTAAEFSSLLPNSNGPHFATFALGQTDLFGQMGEHGRPAIGFDLFYSYLASYHFKAFINFHQSSHRYQEKKVAARGAAAGLQWQFYQFENFSAYALGGLGYYWPKEVQVLNGELLATDTKPSLGFTLGVGSDLRLNQDYLFNIITQVHKPFRIKQENATHISGAYLRTMLGISYNF